MELGNRPEVRVFPNLAGESWRPVAGFEGRYDVSDQGRVRSLRLVNGVSDIRRPIPKLLVLSPSRGYPSVQFSKGNHKRTRFVHVLVLTAFRGPRPFGREGAHLDGDRSNCRLDNLVWATHVENEGHKRLHGRGPQGSRNPHALLVESDVVEIRSLRKDGVGAAFIADAYEISTAQIHSIVRRRSWGHLP